MATDFKYDVFLSHSTKDKAVVRPLTERLRQDGLKGWFDEWELPSPAGAGEGGRRPGKGRGAKGDSIPENIEEWLEHSRVLTCSGVVSPRRWMLCMSANVFGPEWAQVRPLNHQPACSSLNQDRRLIPLRLDDAPVKGSLAQFLCINWRPADREQDLCKLLEVCRPPARQMLKSKLARLVRNNVVFRDLAQTGTRFSSVSQSERQARLC